MLTLNNNVLKIGNNWILPINGLGPTPPSTTYYVTTSATHGSVTASPTEGTTGTEVTLSNTPDAGYTFDKYTLISGTGASISGNTLTIGTSNVTVRGDFVVNYNPLGLPANTVRVRTRDGNPPIKVDGTTYETATLVSGTTDVYDVYKSGTSFQRMFYSYSLYVASNIVEVLGANTTGITNMNEMFRECSYLTSVPLFDTSSVTSMGEMFRNCISLTTVPLFDTSSVTIMGGMFRDCISLTSVPLFDTSSATSMGYMFKDCTKVQSGALALYQQASSQTTPPSSHAYTFSDCGSNTTTGAAELAQIPSSWGGTGA